MKPDSQKAGGGNLASVLSFKHCWKKKKKPIHYINFLCVKQEECPSVWTCAASPSVTLVKKVEKKNLLYQIHVTRLHF